MGSICTIYTDINRWTIVDSGLRLKATGEPVVTVKYGFFDDDMTGAFEMEMLMRASIIDGLKTRRYSIHKEAAANRQLTVLDENNKAITPYKKNIIY